MKDEPMTEKKPINTKALWSLHTFLSGMAQGKGNLRPLGLEVLDDLENTIKYLEGDERFITPKEWEYRAKIEVDADAASVLNQMRHSSDKGATITLMPTKEQMKSSKYYIDYLSFRNDWQFIQSLSDGSLYFHSVVTDASLYINTEDLYGNEVIPQGTIGYFWYNRDKEAILFAHKYQAK